MLRPETGGVGWKLNLLARRSRPGDNFDALARAFGFDPPAAERLPLERALHPSPGVALAHWNDHLLILSSSLANGLLASPLPDATGRKALAVLGPGRVLAATLHSVTNLYGYALYESGKLVRGKTGAADEGVIWEQGQAFDWEKSWLEDFDGEQAVFSFLSECFGSPLDVGSEQLFALEVCRYATSLSGRLKRLFGI